MSQCGFAVTPASVAHSLAAPSRSDKGCQRREKKIRVGETDSALQREAGRGTGNRLHIQYYANESAEPMTAVIRGCVPARYEGC